MDSITISNSRQFLNPLKDDDTGLLQSHVIVHRWSIDAEFSIWDCNRKISLNFDCYSHEDILKRAEKVDKLIEHLQQFRKGLGKAFVVACDKDIFKENLVPDSFEEDEDD